jgi:hypothetical protein
MKWNDIFFNANFTESVQKGINDFARLSGYNIKETKHTEKNKPSAKHSLLYLLLLCLLLAVLLSTLPLNARDISGDKKNSATARMKIYLKQ